MQEYIIENNSTRFISKPIDSKYKKIWDLYKKQQEVYWNAEEIKYTQKDIDDFNNLKQEEQYFLKLTLAFFASSDGIINFNLRERFLQEFKPYEILTAYTFQMMMEGIHGEVYSDLILNIIKDENEKNILLNSIEKIDAVKKMMDWTLKWIHSKDDIGIRLIAFAIVEGVFFSGMFASIFWIKKYKPNFLEAIIKSNKFISRDEGLHVQFACEVYKHIQNKVDVDIVFEIMKEANNITENFMNDALKIDLIGMNKNLMVQYINYVSDRLLIMLGYKKLYNAVNPFDFMDTIALHNKDNFFDTRPDSYQSANNDKNKNDVGFIILENF